MAFTYEWKVTGLKVKDQVNNEGSSLTNAVVQTYWELKGTDENGNVGSFNGATPFTAEEVPADSFRPFEELTEEDVLGWIKAVVNGDAFYKQHIDEQIQKRIDETTVTEITGSSLPWGPADDLPTPEESTGSVTPEEG